jgi:4-amino-4-deoxy-L-arabinose transferase-like glycosyltransferase
MSPVDADRSTRGQPRSELKALLGLTLLALLVRAVPVWGSTFPLLDGGLLDIMASDLSNHAFVIPAFTTYNGGYIPFVYPPLAPYLLAVLHQGGVGLTDLLRWLPLLFATLTVPAVYLLAREFQSQRAATASAAAYALMPGAFQLLIVGGGASRAPGVLFAALATQQTMSSLKTKKTMRAVLAGGFGGLATLFHPQAAVFVAVVALVVIGWHARSRVHLRLAGTAILTGAAVVSPWVMWTVSHHGLVPFFQAFQSRSPIFVSLATVLFVDITGAVFSVFLGFALIGLIAEVSARRFLLAVVLVAVLFAIPTPSPVVGDPSLVLIPISMFIGVGVADIVLPAIAARSGERAYPKVVASLLAAGLLASLGVPYAGQTPFFSTTSGQREAMRWVEHQVPATATFAVITGQVWPEDAISEWFPALASRASLGTPQGFEWTSAWATRVDSSVSLQRCASKGFSCLIDWARSFALRPSYLFVAKGPVMWGPQASDDCCARLREDARALLPIVYDGPGATIALWTGPP